MQLIDNTITEFNSVANLATSILAADTVYKNAANAFDVYFADGSAREVSIQYEGKGITFSPLNAANELSNHISTENCVLAIGEVENCAVLSELTATGNNTVTYADAFTNTDLVYVLENNALKEYIILNSISSPNEFSFMFTLDGVTMQTADGSAYFTAEDGSAVFALDTLFAMDANGVITEDLNYSFAPIANTNKVIITVTLDEAYLSSAERAFPVVIDPTIMISSSETADACVCSNTPNTNYQMATQLRTGFEPDYGIRRSYIKFNIPSTVPANCVTNATLDIEKQSGVAPTIRAYRCTATWASGTITWNNKPSFTTTNQSTLSTLYSSGSTWYTMNVTSIVQSWVNGVYSNYGFVIKDVTEADPDHWTTLYSSDAESPHKPELHITYTAFFGCKPYVQNNSTGINCHGYAYFVNEWPEFIVGDYLTRWYNATTSNQLLSITKEAMEDWLDTNFSGKWTYGSLETQLNSSQWLIAMRTGCHYISERNTYDRDYHFWYRTETGNWANKHGSYPSEMLPISNLPTSSSTTGWDLIYVVGGVYFTYSNFYDSNIVYYVITE